MARLSVPTSAKLPSSLRVDPSNPAVLKSLSRLSREALITLALNWLEEDTVPNAIPYLERGQPDEDEDDPDDLYPPGRSIGELRELYSDLQQQKGSKRDVATRILEGDWRHGLTLYQLAMADMAYLDEHHTSQKWTAYRILPLEKPNKDAPDDEVLKVDKRSLAIPRFHPSTFLQNLQDQVLPDVKAHYHFYRPKGFPVLLLRIFVIDSPYNSELALSNPDGSGAANFDSSRTIYIAFPDGSPSLYITRSQSTGPIGQGESKSLQSLIVDGVPKALSRPRERYALKSTSLTSRNLGALLDKKGSGRGNAAGGGWSVYTDEKVKDSPVDTTLPTPPPSGEFSLTINTRKRGQPPMTRDQQIAKRAKLIAKARFGNSGMVADGKGVERVDIVLRDPFPASDVPEDPDDDDDEETEPQSRRTSRRRSKVDVALQQVNDSDDSDDDGQDPLRWTPTVKVTFSGSHVFAGIRQLVEAGIIDGERMPGWMTGDEGVTVGVVKQGRIQGHKGSGV